MSGPVSRQSRLSTLGFSGKVCSVAVELLYGRQSAFGDLTEIIDGVDRLVTLKSLQCSEHGVVICRWFNVVIGNRNQVILAKKFSIIAFALLIGSLLSCDYIGAQESPKAENLHCSTQDGITVQLEKVTVERILNPSAWLKAKEEES